MEVLCPRHSIPLRIEKKFFDQLRCEAYIGICPKCQMRYVDRHFFQSTSKIKIDRVEYEFLAGLSTVAEKMESMQQKQKEAKKDAHTARKQSPKKKTLQSAKQKKHTARTQQKIHKGEPVYSSVSPAMMHECVIAMRRHDYLENPDKLFHAKTRAYFPKLPEVCPDDKEPLIMLNNVFVEEDKSEGNKGLCCVRCGKLFLHPHKRTGAETPRRSDAPISKEGRVLIKRLKACNGKTMFCPSSTILSVKIQSVREPGEGTVIFVSKKSEEREERCVYWAESVLALSIMTAIKVNSKREFLYEGVRFRITNIQKYAGAGKYIDAACRFSNTNTPQTVYIYKQKNLLARRGEYESVTAMILCKNWEFPIPVTIYYEKYSQRYFMNKTTYDEIMKKHGLPYLHLASAEKEKGGYEGLRENSELNLLGYNVRADGMTVTQRQDLLGEILDSGLMEKADIMNHLEWLISHRATDRKMDNAVAEWRNDLHFVNQYRIKHQRSVFVQRFYVASTKKGYSGKQRESR